MAGNDYDHTRDLVLLDELHFDVPLDEWLFAAYLDAQDAGAEEHTRSAIAVKRDAIASAMYAADDARELVRR